MVYKPVYHDGSAQRARFAVKVSGPFSISAIDVTDNVQVDGWIVLHPFEQFCCDTLRFGVKAVLISQEVYAEDVGPLPHFNGPEVYLDVGPMK